MNVLELSEQEIGRRAALDELRAMGVNPYPADEYPVNAYAAEIKQNFLFTPGYTVNFFPSLEWTEFNGKTIHRCLWMSNCSELPRASFPVEGFQL